MKNWKLEDNIRKDVKNLYRLKKENKAIKARIIRDIRNLFEQGKEDYYEPVKVGHFWSRNYIEYGSDGDRNKILSIEQYLKKIELYLKDITNDLKKSDIWKIHLTIAINFITSKDTVEECVMHSKSDNK